MSEHGRYSQNLSSVSNELRHEGKFLDAVIKVEDAEFEIHRLVLSSCSPYFRAYFSHWPEDSMVFHVSGLSPQMMELIIEYAYTGSVLVTEDNVQELMMAADMLCVDDLLKTCSEFLRERLSCENCVGIWQCANVCFCPELRREAFRFILGHFEELMDEEAFLQLSAYELSEILDTDNLNVREESFVYDAILRWISYMPGEREKHIDVLFSKVRLALTSEQYITNTVMSSELVKESAACCQTAQKAIQALQHMSTHALRDGVCNLLARPRLPHAILLAIGGWSGGSPTNGIEAYDVRAGCWLNVTDNTESPRAYHGAAFLNNCVYCVGGYDRVEHFNTVRRLDLVTRSWQEVSPMHFRRCYVSVTVLNGCIYAMGGFDGATRVSSAECYRPETNQWSLIAPMHKERSDASSTSLHGKVYICGGFDGREFLQSAEYYNVETDQWIQIRPMSSRRSGVGVIAYADHVFAVGGFDGNTRLRSAEAYNPITNTWRSVSSMLTPRSNFGIEVINDHLFAIGGFDGISTTNKTEYYDAASDQWLEARDMEFSRSALSCCVISGLTNLPEYSVPRDALPFLTFEDEDTTSMAVSLNK